MKLSPVSRTGPGAWKFLGFYPGAAEIGRDRTCLKMRWASEASPLAREGVGHVDVGVQRGSCCCPRPGIAPSAGTVGFAGSDTEPFITVTSPCLGSAPSPRTYFIRMHSPAETKAHKAPALSLQVQRLKLSLPYFTDAIPQDTGNGY